MSKIDELIQQFCPEGVEYCGLGEIEDSGLIKLGRGMVISKNDIAETPGDYPVYSSSAVGNGEFGRYGKYMFDDERISWSVDGGGRFFYRPAQKYSVTNVSGWLKVNDDTKLNTRYLFYVLDSAWQTKVFDYTKKAHPSVIRNEYKIPIPPLEIQREIVDILDKFTQLEAELEAELEARKKQYEHYRNQLLTFDDAGGVRWTTLGEVVKMARGVRVVKKDLAETGEIPVFQNSMTPLGYYHESNNKADTTFVITAGAAGEVGYCSSDFWAADDCFALICPDDIDDRFLYHFMKTQQKFLLSRVRRASIPRLSRTVIEKIQLPIPAIAEQKRIADLLDKFDALVNDISIGLPAELAARRKQYEYYRNKLLTFPEKQKEVANA